MIWTFYSYKGGVGRSMALANVADILARAGLRVLMVDFDLEAPGLEQFFPVNHREVQRHQGLLDLLLTYKNAMSVVTVGPEEDEGEAFRELDNFIIPIYAILPSGGKLDMLPAGEREDEDKLARYALNLRTFDWQDFYFNWAGATFFEWFHQSLVPALYDVVLVDSRTGVTEMGGICAYQLADAIVMLCASNHQNVEGTLNVVKNFFSPRVQKLRGKRPLQLIVVPARIEQNDSTLITNFRDRFEQAFDEYTPPALRQRHLALWDLLIPYEPLYAFEEQVITDPSRIQERRQMAAAFEKLVDALTLLAEPGTALANIGATRGALEAPVEPRYDVARRFAEYDAFLTFHRDDRVIAEQLNALLENAGLRCWIDQSDLMVGESVPDALEELLFHSRACLVLVGSSGQGPWQNESFRKTLTAQVSKRDFRVIPVLLPGASPELPLFLTDRQAVDLRSGLSDARVIQRLTEITQGVMSSSPQITVHYRCPYPGMVPFHMEDARFFHGREAEVELILNHLRNKKFLFVIGPSASGKSSLIHAGILPRLTDGSLFPKDFWLVREMRPGVQPLQTLSQTIGGDVGHTSASIAALLAAHQPAERFLLVIDQFEEIFTQVAGPEQFQFITALNIVRKLENCVLLITMRADFYADLLTSDLWPIHPSERLEIAPLPGNALRRAIVMPAQQVGVAIEPGMVERLLQDAADEPGVLPLIQETLTLLWDTQQDGWLRLSAYEQLGSDGRSGLTVAISTKADTTLAKLTPAQQTIARRIFLRLVQFGEGRADTRRQQPIAALRALDDDQDLFEQTLRHLADNRLLTLSGEEENRERKVDIAHEALITGWPTLFSWLTQRREAEQIRRRLQATAAEWVRLGRGNGGLLDAVELPEAERWLASADADDLGYDKTLLELVQVSRVNIEQIKRERESVRQRELDQAQALAREQLQRAEAQAMAARRLRRNSVVLLISMVITLSVAILAGYGFNQALLGRQEAEAALRAESNARATAVAALNAERAANESAATIYSPDGKYLAAATRDGDVRVFDVVSGQPLAILRGGSAVTSTEFSPNGRLLAIAGADNTVRLWRVAEGKEVTALEGHTATVREITFSPDAKRIATASDDGTARLWDLEGHLIVILSDHTGALTSIRFSPDGRTLTTSTADGIIRLWDTATGMLLTSSSP